MRKKLLVGLVSIGASIAVLLRFRRGSHHYATDSASTQEAHSKVTDESTSNTEAEENEGGVSCVDTDCDRTFDSEHGMRVHYGRVHDNDD